MSTTITLAISIVIFSLLRLVFFKLPTLREYFRLGPLGDSAVYFLFIQFLRTNKIGCFDPRFVLSNDPINYPHLYEKTVGWLFSDSTLNRIPWLPNYIIFNISLIFLCIYGIFSFAPIDAQPEEWMIFIWTIGCIFITWPDHTIFDRHRVHFISLQPRYYGAILASLHFLICTSDLLSSTTWFFLDIFVLYLCWNISIFTRQAITLITLCFSLISMDYLPFIGLLLSFLIRALVNRRNFLVDIEVQLSYHKWYFNNYPKAVKSGKFFRDLIGRLFPYYITELPTNIFFILLIILFMSGGLDIPQLPLLGQFLLSVNVVILFTSIRYFAFLGESWRYISFSTLFVVPLALAILVTQGFFQGVVAGGVLVAVGISYLKNRRPICIGKDAELILDLVGNLSDEEARSAVIASWPVELSIVPLVRGVTKGSFWFQIGNQGPELMGNTFSTFPILLWNERRFKEACVTHILVDRTIFDSLSHAVKTNILNLSKLAENSRFILYKFS